jgi:hypothetical protein
MGEVIKFRKPDLRAKADRKTLCKSGHHRWQVVKENSFDVKRGKLVTLVRCARCGKQDSRLT